MNRSAPPVFQPFVLTKKTAALQRLGDYVRQGYRWYVSGALPLEKVLSFCQKQDARHGLGWSVVRTREARKAGRAVYRLLLLRQEREPDLTYFWLLRTEGEQSPESQRESWRDATKKGERLTFEGYELYRDSKPGTDHPVWTWRIPLDAEKELRERVILLIRRKQDGLLQDLLDGVYRAPGFSGVRHQLKKLRQLVCSEWKRSRKDSEPMPVIPDRIGYVRRLPNLGQPLWEILEGKPRQRAVRAAKALPLRGKRGGGVPDAER